MLEENSKTAQANCVTEKSTPNDRKLITLSARSPGEAQCSVRRESRGTAGHESQDLHQQVRASTVFSRSPGTVCNREKVEEELE